MLAINILGIYAVTKSSFANATITDIIFSLFYVTVHLILMTLICHFGSSTTYEADSIKITFAKGMNKIHLLSEKSSMLYVYKQIESRDLRLQNVSFVVDWKVFFGTIYTVVTFLIITCQFQSPLR
ncbi:unnamed protein product [Chironomus riparius]|uniref:Uncharacterized protein n=1 Tax=Chironomus riparius TaxID=315576 RepID=A0A9N9RQ70_9DIPT|nr:unnamed protein product [Chironomus riparius]